MIFTMGNLLTLGIVLVALILYRQLDRNNRSLEKLRKYGERLRDELAAFVAERESAVKDYAVELDVQRKAAKELLNRLQSVEEGIATRAEGISKLDERIGSYDKSLEDLLNMTARAQENLERLKDESEFTDGVLKRVKEAKDKLEDIEKGLSDTELRFERENEQALERTAEAVVAAVKSTAADLQETAETIERRVEDHRDAVVQIEKDRAAQVAADAALIRDTFKEALAAARREADTLEDAAFAKLKEQAVERSRRFHEAVEEKITQFQEAAKTRLVEVQGLLKGFKAEWQKEAAELSERQKAYRDEWKKDAAELAALAKAEREESKRETQDLHAGFAAVREETARNEQAALARAEAVRGAVDKVEADFRRRAAALDEAVKRVEENALASAGEDAARRQAEIRAAVDSSIAAVSDRLVAESQRVEQGVRTVEAAAADLSSRLEAFVREFGDRLTAAAEEAERAVLQETDSRLESYRAAASARFERLERLADDVGRLDAELRRSMEATEARVREDFALFERESEEHRNAAAARAFQAAAALRADMEGVEKELAALKTRAYENVSEKLKLFEDDFFADLSRRSEDIDRRLDAWKQELDSSLGALAVSAETERSKTEAAYAEELRGKLAEHAEKATMDLARLKEQTGAFEEGIREQMAAADQSLQSFKEQLVLDLEEARSSAAAATKAEIARHSLAMADQLKKDERELDETLKTLLDSVDERKAQTAERLDAVRRELESWQASVSRRLMDADAAVEDARKRARDLAAESDERLASVRAALEEAREEAAVHRNELLSRTADQVKAIDASVAETDRRLKDFISQTKLFDRADELRTELERRMEDLSSELDRVDQRSKEAAELEAQFVKIKRLEDEVNAKMTRFLTEKRRIELMEADFKRLIQTAQSVDEKLAQVTASDDTLTQFQAQLRRLEEAAKDAEAKYERVEKKSQILDATADGIDRNFQALREAEAAAKRFDEELKRVSGAIASVKDSVERLSADKERADEATEKLETLEKTMDAIDGRIENMQKAREWLARTETRLEEVSKQAQEQVKLMGSLLKAEGGKSGAKDRGAPPLGVRETVVKLAHQGWSIDEIARAVKLSKGEVELILEISPKA